MGGRGKRRESRRKHAYLQLTMMSIKKKKKPTYDRSSLNFFIDSNLIGYQTRHRFQPSNLFIPFGFFYFSRRLNFPLEWMTHFWAAEVPRCGYKRNFLSVLQDYRKISTRRRETARERASRPPVRTFWFRILSPCRVSSIQKNSGVFLFQLWRRTS